MTAFSIVDLLMRHTFKFVTERDLQDGVESVLKSASVAYEREYRLDRANRPDFFLRDRGLAIEIKIKGSHAEVSRQIERYAKFDQVREIILLSSRMTHGACPGSVNGKTVHKVRLWNL